MREELTRKERVVRWMLQPTRRVWVAVLFILICVLIAVVLHQQGQIKGTQKQQASEQQQQANEQIKSCAIQSRGLEANTELTTVIQEIHAILVLPRSVQSKAELKALPAWLRRYELGLIAGLTYHTNKYVEIQNKQPASRKC